MSFLLNLYNQLDRQRTQAEIEAEAKGLHLDDDPATAKMMAPAPQLPDGATWANALRTIHEPESRVAALETHISQCSGDF